MRGKEKKTLKITWLRFAESAKPKPYAAYTYQFTTYRLKKGHDVDIQELSYEQRIFKLNSV